MNYYRGSSWL